MLKNEIAILKFMAGAEAAPNMSRLDFEVSIFSLKQQGLIEVVAEQPTGPYTKRITVAMTRRGQEAMTATPT